MSLGIRDGLINLLKISKGNPFLIEAKNKKLYIGTYTDYHKVIYETGIDSEDFRAIISSEIAKDIIDIASQDFEVKENSMIFRQKDNTTVINLEKESINLFDLAKGYEKINVSHFNGKEFKDAFNYVRHASNDKSLGDTVLRGFHLTINSNKAEVMASNGFVLSVVPLQQINDEFQESATLLLNPDFYNITKLIPDSPIHLGYNESSVSLTCESEDYVIRIITSLTKGNPLPYQRVLSDVSPKNLTKYVLSKNSFLSSAKQARVFSEDKSTLKFYNTGEVDIFSSGKKGETKVSIEVKEYSLKDDDQESIEIKINSDYLLRFLQSVKSELIQVKLNSESSPVLFEDNFGIEMIAPLLK